MGYFQIPNGSQRSTKRYSFFIAYILKRYNTKSYFSNSQL